MCCVSVICINDALQQFRADCMFQPFCNFLLLFYYFLLRSATTKQGPLLSIAKIYLPVQCPVAGRVNSHSAVCYRFYLHTLDRYCIYLNIREHLWKIYMFMKNTYFYQYCNQTFFFFTKAVYVCAVLVWALNFFCAKMAHFDCCFSFFLHWIFTWKMTNFCVTVQLVVSSTSFMS